MSPPTVTPSDRTPYFTPANHGVGAALHPSSSTPTLFKPLTIRSLTLKNRIVVSPMCMYSASPDPADPAQGALTDFHLAHLGHLALKGAGLVFVEAQAVEPRGRISPNDAGLWQGPESEQFRGLRRVVDFAHAQGAKVGIQLAHAGRKASVTAPWVAMQHGTHSLRAEAEVGGWPDDVVGPSGGPEHTWDKSGYWTPRALTEAEIQDVVQAFARSAATGVQAGVDVIEIHAAHGYLLHQFLSPVTNRRDDDYGGSFENRTRLLREVVQAVRGVIPDDMPLFVRISATEWLEDQSIAAETGSWDLASSQALVALLPTLGVDLVDVSSGGNHPLQQIPLSNKAYQTDLAGQLRRCIRAAGHSTLVGTVGFITEAEQARGLVEGADEAHRAEATVSGPQPTADVVLLARQFLREPEWVYSTAKKLGVQLGVPVQFGRAGGVYHVRD